MQPSATPHRALDADALRVQLRRNGRGSLRMAGRSMRPLLPEGTVAHLRPLAEDESLEGAIVAMDLGDRVVVHRVVSEDATTVTTKGLLSRELDAPIDRSNVLGVVAGSSRRWLRSEAQLRRATRALSSTIARWRR